MIYGIKDVESYLQKLLLEVKSKRYRVSKYFIFERVTGGKLRQIYKLPMKDRIVLHAIMNYLEPIFRESFIVDTYSSIKTRGLHMGLKRVKRAIRKGNCRYCLKLDIHKCYPSLNQSILKRKLKRKIKDKNLLDLLYTIIDSCNKGVPIGNYTSLYFNNYYFSAFDHWLKENQGIKYYFRYCDDIVILSLTKDDLHILFQKILKYISSLKVTLKSNYLIFPIEDRSVDFLGYKIREKYTLLRKLTKINFILKVSKINFEKITDRNINVLGSYWGILKHANCRHLWHKYIKFVNFRLFIEFIKTNKDKNRDNMKWYKGHKNNFKSAELTGKGVYELHLSPINITPSEDDDTDVIYLKYNVHGNLSTTALKKALLDLQLQYDKDTEVNKFIIEGKNGWLSKADRVGLIHSLEVLKKLNLQFTTLWIDGKSYLVDIDYLMQFLNELEIYAIECFNVTQRHVNEIRTIKTREELFLYNITSGYPQHIIFNPTTINKD